MNNSDSGIQALIKEVCKNKKHIKLTIGILTKDEKTIQVFNETGEIENGNYIYEIGSITKTFAVSLMAKLVHEQKMSLDDSIQKYMDGLDKEAYYPTLKRLATHTAGYRQNLGLSIKNGSVWLLRRLLASPKDCGLPYPMDLEKMKRIVQKTKLQDKDYPWRYSNFGIALIGYAAGTVSGGYQDAIKDFISKELGLPNTYPEANPSRNLHGFNKKNRDVGNTDWGNDLIAPAGSISSTAEDLLEYARINMYEERPYLASCHQKHAEGEKLNMGLGWIMSKRNSNVLWHNGETNAFQSFLAFDKEKKCAVVVLSNCLADTDRLGAEVLKAI